MPLPSFSTVVLLQPMAKQRPRVVRSGARVVSYTPSKTVHAEALIRTQVKDAGIFYDREIPLAMELRFYFPRPAHCPSRRVYPVVRPDIDNLAKTVTDALNGFLFADDSQLCEITLRKLYTDQMPSVAIHVWPMVIEADIPLKKRRKEQGDRTG